MPRQARSMAKVSPTGPAPTTRTFASTSAIKPPQASSQKSVLFSKERLVLKKTALFANQISRTGDIPKAADFTQAAVALAGMQSENQDLMRRQRSWSIFRKSRQTILPARFPDSCPPFSAPPGDFCDAHHVSPRRYDHARRQRCRVGQEYRPHRWNAGSGQYGQTRDGRPRPRRQARGPRIDRGIALG